jgi:hypothetical protein
MRSIPTLLVGLFVSLSALQGHAADRLLPYQGELAGAAGSVNVTVALYDAATAGSLVWGPESHRVLLDADGHFVIVVGSSAIDVDLNGRADLDEIDLYSLYLEVVVDEGTTQTVLTPRQPLRSGARASVADGLSRDIVLDDFSDAVLRELAPTGMVMAWPGAEANIPQGWLLCDGSEYLRTRHPVLSSLLLPIYGSSSSNLFRVPDYRGQFLRGTDAGTGRDAYRAGRSSMFAGSPAGDSVGTLELDYTQRPGGSLASGGSHSHNWSSYDGYANAGGGVDTGGGSGTYDWTSTAGSHDHPVFLGGDPETRPVNASVHFIIKY